MHLGMDIGGTKQETVLLDNTGHIVWKQRSLTQKKSLSAFVEGVRQDIEEAIAFAGGRVTLGLCLPGTIDSSTMLMKNSNITVLNGHPLQRILTEQFRQPVAISNDANCFTLSEAIDGSGEGKKVMFGVILGTGCGGGLAVGQQILEGANACCGEWGHNPLPHYAESVDGPATRCYCGQWNCTESFISGTGLARQYAQMTGSALQTEQIVQLMRQKDHLAVQVWQHFRHQLARALSGIVNVVDPDIIVVGGGLSSVPELYTGLSEAMAAYVFGRRCVTPVVAARHGASSGVRGAAWLGRQ